MPRVKLTDRFVQSAKTTTPSRVDFSDESQRGLVLRVTPNGARTFAASYYRDGKARGSRLARPTSSHSRTLASRPRQSVPELSGENPAAEKRLARTPPACSRAACGRAGRSPATL